MGRGREESAAEMREDIGWGEVGGYLMTAIWKERREDGHKLAGRRDKEGLEMRGMEKEECRPQPGWGVRKEKRDP